MPKYEEGLLNGRGPQKIFMTLIGNNDFKNDIGMINIFDFTIPIASIVIIYSNFEVNRFLIRAELAITSYRNGRH